MKRQLIITLLEGLIEFLVSFVIELKQGLSKDEALMMLITAKNSLIFLSNLTTNLED